MTKLMYDIQASLKECIQQAQMFSRAAYYDSSASHVPFQSLKEGGNRNPAGIDAEEFQQMLGVDIHSHKENESPTVSLGMPVGVGRQQD